MEKNTQNHRKKNRKKMRKKMRLKNRLVFVGVSSEFFLNFIESNLEQQNFFSENLTLTYHRFNDFWSLSFKNDDIYISTKSYSSSVIWTLYKDVVKLIDSELPF